MSKHRKIVLGLLLSGIVLMAIMLLGYVGNNQIVYALIRLALSMVAVVAVSALFVQALQRIRQLRNSPEQRLRMATIIFLLAEITILLGISAAYDWDRAPPTDPVQAVISVMIRASLAFGATILALTAPEIEQSGKFTAEELFSIDEEVDRQMSEDKQA